MSKKNWKKGDFIAGVWNGIGKYVFANGETVIFERKENKKNIISRKKNQILTKKKKNF